MNLKSFGTRVGYLLVLVLTLSVSSVVEGQELTAVDVIRGVVSQDPDIRAAELDERSARVSRALVRARVQPQISVAPPSPSAGSVSWSREATLDQTQISPAEELLSTASAGARVGVTQALPTDGVLTAGAYAATRRTRLGDSDPTFIQTLGATIQVQQPLLVNGKFIDLSMFGAGQELAAELPLRLATTATVTVSNRRVMDVLAQFFQVADLRSRLALIERRVSVTADRLDQLRIRVRQGTVTERTLWDNELSLDELRETQLETEYALLQAEYEVAGSTGLGESLAGFTISPTLPELPTVPSLDEATGLAVDGNAGVRTARESLEQRRLQRVINGRDYGATLSARFTIEPTYPLDYTGSENLGDSFSELFSEDAGWSPSLSLGLSIPVYNGGQAQLRRSQDAAAVEAGEIALENATGDLRQLVRGLFLRRRLLQDQLTLRMSTATLQSERLAEQETLAELNSITEIDLREATIARDERLMAVTQTKNDLFLNALAIFDATGLPLTELLGVRDQ